MDYSAERSTGLVPGNRASGARPQAGLPEAINSLKPSLDRLAILRETLSNLADRLGGSRPAEAQIEKAPDPPHHIVDDLLRKSREFETLIQQCEQERDRLGNLLAS